MTDLRKAAEDALLFLDNIRVYEMRLDLIEKYPEIKETLRQALAQPEQEPVAWMHCLPDGHNVVSTSDESAFIDGFTGTYSIIPLYTAPPKREWQGLTDEEILDEYRQCYGDDGTLTDCYFARAIIERFKERNK